VVIPAASHYLNEFHTRFGWHGSSYRPVRRKP
jgi:hypothetical protein